MALFGFFSAKGCQILAICYKIWILQSIYEYIGASICMISHQGIKNAMLLIAPTTVHSCTVVHKVE